MLQYTVTDKDADNSPLVVRSLKALLNETPAGKAKPLTVNEKIDATTLTYANTIATQNGLGGSNKLVTTRTLVFLAKKHGSDVISKKTLPPMISSPLTLIPGLPHSFSSLIDAFFTTPIWMYRLFSRPGDDNLKRPFDAEQFRIAYKENFKEYLPPGATWEPNLDRFSGWVQADTAMNDSRWEAYAFATAMHEGRSAADTWKATWNPVSETGGKDKTYGAEETVVDWEGLAVDSAGLSIKKDDPPNPARKPFKKRYYGRGYVQITHQENYRAMDNALNQANQLLINPEKTITEPELSYKILSYGLRNGSFRGKKRSRDLAKGYYGGYDLATYLNATGSDYENARQIVNGDTSTNGKKIADYALIFKAILEATATT